MTTSQPPLRIGDSERDSAAAALSEHYANGRLTKSEYDERLEAVWAAKFDADLGVVFTDLPGPAPRPVSETRPAAPRSGWLRQGLRGAPQTRLLWLVLAAVLIGGLTFGVLSNAPWLLFVAFWLFACGGFGRHHHSRRQYGGARQLRNRVAGGHQARCP